jgi:hypothetical protein
VLLELELGSAESIEWKRGLQVLKSVPGLIPALLRSLVACSAASFLTSRRVVEWKELPEKVPEMAQIKSGATGDL